MTWSAVPLLAVFAAAGTPQATALPERSGGLRGSGGAQVADPSTIAFYTRSGVSGRVSAAQRIALSRMALASITRKMYKVRGNVSAKAELKALFVLEKAAAEVEAKKRLEEAKRRLGGTWRLSKEGAGAEAKWKLALLEKQHAQTHAPPYSFHGSFRESNFSDRNYPVKPADFAALMPEGNWDQLR